MSIMTSIQRATGMPLEPSTIIRDANSRSILWHETIFIVRHASSAVIENNGRFSGKVLADSFAPISARSMDGEILPMVPRGDTFMCRFRRS